MKKLICCFFAMTIFAAVSYAQTSSNLQGPKAKNYKPWKDNAEKSAVVYMAETSGKRVTGPAAKNRKPGYRNSPAASYLAVTSKSTDRITGVRAKNPRRGWSSGNGVGNGIAQRDAKETGSNVAPQRP